LLGLKVGLDIFARLGEEVEEVELCGRLVMVIVLMRGLAAAGRDLNMHSIASAHDFIPFPRFRPIIVQHVQLQ
jgi:hypothetical protein